MAFITEKHLDDCKDTYQLSDSIKKYTLMDTTFMKNKIGGYMLLNNQWFSKKIKN